MEKTEGCIQISILHELWEASGTNIGRIWELRDGGILILLAMKNAIAKTWKMQWKKNACKADVYEKVEFLTSPEMSAVQAGPVPGVGKTQFSFRHHRFSVAFPISGNLRFVGSGKGSQKNHAEHHCVILWKSFMHKGMKDLLGTPARYETYRGGFSGSAEPSFKGLCCSDAGLSRIHQRFLSVQFTKSPASF